MLSFQKIVAIEQVEERIGELTQENWEGLFTICLPDRNSPQQGRLFLEPTGKAMTVSSLNPNLRVAGHLAQDVNLSNDPSQAGQPMKFFGFAITISTSFVQVAEYNGRWFVRDGYHRCYGLLRNGITRIPCIFIRAQNFAETGAEQPGFYRYEVLFGERPAFLKDFLADAVSATVQQQAVRKVVRITAEEFAVEL